MTIDDKIRDEKLRYKINIATVKLSASPVNIDKYEYLTGKEILPMQQHGLIDKAKISYSPMGRHWENK